MEELEKEPYKILISGGCGEIIEKKSRFIATVCPVETEEEATAFIDEMKKKYWDARHNCSAFVIGSRAELTRCSDDGEPSGTAGRPMLEVLTGSGIRNIAVVVTRYFGGVLLGTGGLVRAYTQAVQAGIEACETAWVKYCVRFRLEVSYTEVGKVQYLLAAPGIMIEDSEYTDKVTFTFVIAATEAAKITKDLTEGTNGRLTLTEVEKDYMQLKE